MTRGHQHIYEALLKDYKKVKIPESFLDLGCGFGALLKAVSHLGTSHLSGIDASKNMVSQTKKTVPAANVKQGFFERLPFEDNQFSHIASVEALYYSKTPTDALKEVKRILQKNGRFDMLIDFYAESQSTKIWEKNLNVDLVFWTEKQWAKELKQAGFQSVEQKRVVHPHKTEMIASYKPSPYFPNKEDFIDYMNQGTLWITAY